MAYDFSVTEQGSFNRLDALSSRARSAQDGLLLDLEALPSPTGGPAWRVFPRALANVLAGLRAAGYRVTFL